MKTIFTLLCLVPLFLFGKTNFDELVEINSYWKTIPKSELPNQLHEKKIQLSSTDWISYHLKNVESILRAQSTKNLTKIQKQNRLKSLDSLHVYWNEQAFPINDMYSYRLPIFIDKYDNFCAVGYLIKASGNEKLSRRIQQQMNTAYLREMTDIDGLSEWIAQSGFTFEELALIQPSYTPSGPYLVDVPNDTVSVGQKFKIYLHTWNSYGRLVKAAFDSWKITGGGEQIDSSFSEIYLGYLGGSLPLVLSFNTTGKKTITLKSDTAFKKDIYVTAEPRSWSIPVFEYQQKKGNCLNDSIVIKNVSIGTPDVKYSLAVYGKDTIPFLDSIITFKNFDSVSSYKEIWLITDKGRDYHGYRFPVQNVPGKISIPDSVPEFTDFDLKQYYNHDDQISFENLSNATFKRYDGKSLHFSSKDRDISMTISQNSKCFGKRKKPVKIRVYKPDLPSIYYLYENSIGFHKDDSIIYNYLKSEGFDIQPITFTQLIALDELKRNKVELLVYSPKSSTSRRTKFNQFEGEKLFLNKYYNYSDSIKKEVYKTYLGDSTKVFTKPVSISRLKLDCYKSMQIYDDSYAYAFISTGSCANSYNAYLNGGHFDLTDKVEFLTKEGYNILTHMVNLLIEPKTESDKINLSVLNPDALCNSSDSVKIIVEDKDFKAKYYPSPDSQMVITDATDKNVYFEYINSFNNVNSPSSASYKPNVSLTGLYDIEFTLNNTILSEKVDSIIVRYESFRSKVDFTKKTSVKNMPINQFTNNSIYFDFYTKEKLTYGTKYKLIDTMIIKYTGDNKVYANYSIQSSNEWGSFKNGKSNYTFSMKSEKDTIKIPSWLFNGKNVGKKFLRVKNLNIGATSKPLSSPVTMLGNSTASPYILHENKCEKATLSFDIKLTDASSPLDWNLSNSTNTLFSGKLEKDSTLEFSFANNEDLMFESSFSNCNNQNKEKSTIKIEALKKNNLLPENLQFKTQNGNLIISYDAPPALYRLKLIDAKKNKIDLGTSYNGHFIHNNIDPKNTYMYELSNEAICDFNKVYTYTGATGISNSNYEGECMVYPTITSSSIHVQCPLESLITDVQLFSINGEIIKKSSSTELDVSDLSQGLYLLKVTGDDFSQSFRIVRE